MIAHDKRALAGSRHSAQMPRSVGRRGSRPSTSGHTPAPELPYDSIPLPMYMELVGSRVVAGHPSLRLVFLEMMSLRSPPKTH